ncbi:MAG: MFS transporter [Oscillatoriophycideae cyanobacterium NC_groundwater_1537_Pr4_S-0.65um_50_18]|nr:MFS transporter [Oscillatoriophycideae cyanobacterium NC_groundwater_1537_Pr4_S-0.65um_50_18]
MNQAKKTVSMLALCQALAMTGSIVLFTTAALIGSTLAADKSLATLPLALLQLATMLTTIPAAFILKQWGRKSGFIAGVLVGLCGAGVGVYAVFTGSFVLFNIATVLYGIFNGFVGYYRFAAADVATESFRSRAISFVIAGGILAALLGPALATWTKDWLPVTFAGGLVAIALLQILTLLLLSWVELPPLVDQKHQEVGRGLGAIAQQPVFIVAVLGSMIGYGVMALLMTATPLAMVAAHHPFPTAASVIQWHVLGMFTPSLFTGYLIARFGVLTIILTGIVFNGLCIAINLAGTDAPHFFGALLLLGIGWNFMFIGSTTLLTETYETMERAKTQATHDFLMLSFVAFSTFLSGRLLNDWGWAVVNYTGLALIGVALIAVLYLRQQRRSALTDRATNLRRG